MQFNYLQICHINCRIIDLFLFAHLSLPQSSIVICTNLLLSKAECVGFRQLAQAQS